MAAALLPTGRKLASTPSITSRPTGTPARSRRRGAAGPEPLEGNLPGVIPTDLRLNEPRYVKLPDIMKAKKKPLDTLTLSTLGVEQRQQLKLVRFEPPPQRQKGVRVKDAAELLEALKKKGLLGPAESSSSPSTTAPASPPAPPTASPAPTAP